MCDLASREGTEVNGVFMGELFDRDMQALNAGSNTVRAGGVDSPLVFEVVVTRSGD